MNVTGKLGDKTDAKKATFAAKLNEAKCKILLCSFDTLNSTTYLQQQKRNASKII